MEALRFNSQCVDCILGKFLHKAPKDADEATRLKYMRGILEIIADTDNSVTAPEIVAAATALKNRMFGFSDDFADIKRHFNELMLSREADIAAQIQNAADPLKTAVRLALLGNYIDFGAMDSVSEKKLSEFLAGAEGIPLHDAEYSAFLKELEGAESLVYLTDNCGEIVLDKLLIKELKKRFPDLSVTVIVRGEPVLNDATMDDACQVGLTEVAEVLGNGTDIAGTVISKLPPKVRAAAERADVIISKGQGNFETLNGCGLNVYYLFLCKCDLFAERFNVPRFTGMMLNDRRLK